MKHILLCFLLMPFTDFFTDKPNYQTCNLVFPSKEIFNSTNAMKCYNRDIDWRKVLKEPDMDDEDEIRKVHYNNKKNQN